MIAATSATASVTATTNQKCDLFVRITTKFNENECFGATDRILQKH